MEWNKQNVRYLLLVVCGGVAFYCALQHLGALVSGIRWMLNVLSPFLLGGTLAFILNVPMRAIERRLFPKERQMKRLRRPLALIFTLVAVGAVIGLASNVIAPGVAVAVMSVVDQLPTAAARLETWVQQLESYLPALEAFIIDLNVNWAAISQSAVAMIQSWGSGLLSDGSGFIGNVVNAVSSFIIGLIFSFYILMQKEKLARQSRQVLYGLLPIGPADRILEVLRLANRTFSGFLSGQCLEACILGAMFVVAMALLKMPYALLVGVLIALTALIPIVGAFIGCAVGAVLIAINNPMQALLFVVMFLIIQQIEGNLIYPHVVGNSVGLPSIWVLAAVTLGGKLMGIVGMLFFIPLCSVLYALFRSYVKNRLQEKKVPAAKWMDAPPDTKKK